MAIRQPTTMTVSDENRRGAALETADIDGSP
jgi:hypothetical protein